MNCFCGLEVWFNLEIFHSFLILKNGVAVIVVLANPSLISKFSVKFELQSDIRQHLDNFRSEENGEGIKDDMLR